MARMHWAHAYIRLERLSQPDIEAALRAAGQERLSGYFQEGWHYPVGAEKAFYFVQALQPRLSLRATPDETKMLVQQVGCDFDALEREPEAVQLLAYRCLAQEMERFAALFQPGDQVVPVVLEAQP